MAKVLDIVPLRSLVAIAETGGFHKAAAKLSLTQSAVSQHVRRLEAVVGHALVEPSGRGSRFTAVGEALLVEARKILDVHDQALHRLLEDQARTLVIGSTEHAADQILQPLMAELGERFPELDVQFRFDRTARLHEALEQGSVDLAVYVAEAAQHSGRTVGKLPLRWCSAPDFIRPPDDQPLPLVAIEAPCSIRDTALRVLNENGITGRVVGDAAYLSGALNGARAGIGVALVAFSGAPPEGLLERLDLPPAPPIAIGARIREGADVEVTDVAMRILTETIGGETPAGAEEPTSEPVELTHESSLLRA